MVLRLALLPLVLVSCSNPTAVRPAGEPSPPGAPAERPMDVRVATGVPPSAETTHQPVDDAPLDVEIQRAIEEVSLVAMAGEDANNDLLGNTTATGLGSDLEASLSQVRESEDGAGSSPSKKGGALESRIAIGAIDALSASTLGPDDVGKRVRSRYLKGLQRCHEQALKRNPTSMGKVTIEFEVGFTGKVGERTVSGYDPTMDECIGLKVARWRFGAPKEDGKPTVARFRLPVYLKPSD